MVKTLIFYEKFCLKTSLNFYLHWFAGTIHSGNAIPQADDLIGNVLASTLANEIRVNVIISKRH
jgi:hypothetical protein